MDKKRLRKVKNLLKMVRKTKKLSMELMMYESSGRLRDVEKLVEEELTQTTFPDTLKFESNEQFEEALLLLKQTDEKTFNEFIKRLEQRYG
jgi:predicted CopG family antitoxin